MLLIIDNYDSFTYNLYQALAAHAIKIMVKRNDQITVAMIEQLQPTAIILSPGPGRPETAGICVALIQALVSGKLPAIPLLGVCLGHQAITFALGGKVVAAPAIIHGKTDLIYHQEQTLYHGLSLPFQAGRYHSLIAERESLPSSLIIESHNDQQIIMGLRHKLLPIFGVQFHPESILSPQGTQLLANFVKFALRMRVGVSHVA